jgi:snurportin-1
MYAETMEEIPNDFIENWVTMICPKGKRCLVTSGRGETIARSRSGHIIGRFQSMLPNGSRCV